MLSKRKGLTLGPLVITPSKELTISKHIKFALDDMCGFHKDEIYKTIESSKVHISNLVYSDVFTIQDRPIIYVYSIDINGVKTSIDTAFYKSTGVSRGTGLKNTWLPTIGIDIMTKTIIKLEEYYVYKYVISPDKISELANPDNKDEIDSLLTYKRFINKNNALTSYYLYGSHIDIVEPLVTVSDIKHDKTYVLYIQSEIKIYTAECQS